MADISFDELSIIKNINNLEITENITNSKIVLKNYFSSAAGVIENIVDNLGNIKLVKDIYADSVLNKYGLDHTSGYEVKEGTSAINTITGLDINELISGLEGNDKIYGKAGNDILIGGTGDDMIDGGAGDDTYIFKKGDGSDTITDSSGNDLLSMEYNPLEMVLQQSGSDLIVSNINNTTDKVTVKSWFSNSNNQIETIKSSSGELLLNSQVSQLIQAMSTLSSNKGMAWTDLAKNNQEETKQILAQYWKAETNK